MSDNTEQMVMTGEELWSDLFQTFMDIGRLNGAITTADMAAMFGGFLAAAAGSGVVVVGKEDMKLVLQMVMNSLDKHQPNGVSS